jgi:hypothetical protein
MAGNARTAWTLANALMFLAFVFSVIVQYNDPDPGQWRALYGAAAVLSGLEIRRRVRPWWPTLVGLVALGWAATLAPRVLGKVPFGSMFAEFEMHNQGVEESREMYGLLLVAIWMGAIALAEWRRRRVTESVGARPA